MFSWAIKNSEIEVKMAGQAICVRALRIATAAALILFGGATVLRGQASVNESSEKSTLYVNGSTGSDSNAGTSAKPFKTVSKGVSVAEAQSAKGTATKVLISSGTYRESISVTGSSSAAVTIEASTSGGVTVSGADVWTGWTPSSGNSSIFTHSWPYAWGNCAQLSGPTEQNIVRRQEMMFVNGSPLTQVLYQSEMTTGTFYVNESGKTAYVWPPAGTNMSTAKVEVSTRNSLLQIGEVKNWVIRGINFQYARGCRNTDEAVFATMKASNILFDSDTFNWNNSEGLDLGDVTDVTVQSSQANHNGQTGFFAQYVNGVEYSSDEASYNNWRGAQGAYYAWNVAGLKFGEVHDATINDFEAYYNQSHGMHLDTDVRTVTINSLKSIDNFNGGIQLEADPGPITLSGATICNNNKMNQTYSGGVNITDSSGITVSSSTLYNNNTSQFEVWGRVGGISVKNYQTGASSQVYNSDFAFESDTIEATGSQKVFSDSYLTADWPRLVDSLSSDYNTWYNGSSATSYTLPVPSSSTNMAFSGWKSDTKQDAHSSWLAPATSPSSSCGVTIDHADFWFVVNSGSNTVSPGSKTSYVLTVTPLDFSGTVSLKADASQVPHASASLSSSSINTSGNSTVTLTTSSSTAAGTYPLTVIANSGNITRTVTVFVVVN
jgi:hypothetical protein